MLHSIYYIYYYYIYGSYSIYMCIYIYMKLHIYVCSTDSTKVCIFKKKKHCFVLVLVFLRHFVLFICSRLKTATAVSTLDTICTFYCVLEIVVIYIELPLGLSNFSFPVPLYFDLPKLHGTYPCLRI